MRVSLNIEGQQYESDMSNPLDISIPLTDAFPQVNAFYAPLFKITPYRSGAFVGSIAEGSSVNFYNVALNPHGNGTHTECLGHITAGKYYINEQFRNAFHLAQLVSVYPIQLENGDRVIDRFHLEQLWQHTGEDALIIRTLPNDAEKLHKLYSGTSPPYFTSEAIEFITDAGIHHLLCDLPSVDREEDGGKLAAHKAFWGLPHRTDRLMNTITELIYVNDDIKDGFYLLNLQTINIQLDASPSRPVLYSLRAL